jgi:hypothetical protein
MKSRDEWVTASEAVTILKTVLPEYSARIRICKRAHEGLIRARAMQFNVGTRVFRDRDVPSEFWWAEGHEALEQDWPVGDFSTWIKDGRIQLKAFGIKFARADVEILLPNLPFKVDIPAKFEAAGTKVFIGHGRASAWRELKDFIQDRLGLPWDEFNRIPVAGVTNIARLSEMLDGAAIALLVMTAEDELTDGEIQARMNVVHEAGLFQGRLGFTKAIVLLEDGCSEFSNIQGLGQIRFPKGNIGAPIRRRKARP